MRSRIVRLLCALAVGMVPAGLSADPMVAGFVHAEVIAIDQEETADALSEWAETAGGYFVTRSFERVVLRVPTPALAGLRGVLDQRDDLIVAYEPGATDVREQLRDVEAAIVARRDGLERILALIDGAGVGATLAFERELRSLNQEIERYEGRRRSILHDLAFARVQVVLSPRLRSVPERQPSSFAWINTVDLYLFIDEMHGGSP